jgi:hypothetical protein
MPVFCGRIDGALPAPSTPSPEAPDALPDGLERLTVRELKALCKQRALKGCGSLPKAALLERLPRSHAPPPRRRPPRPGLPPNPRQVPHPRTSAASKPAWIGWRRCCGASRPTSVRRPERGGSPVPALPQDGTLAPPLRPDRR